jgi:hypothetical protein
VLARGGDPQPGATPRGTPTGGPGEAGGEAGVSDDEHATVRDDPETKPWPRFTGARTAAERRLAVYAWAAARRGRLAARGRRIARWSPGWTFAAVTLAPALLAVAWLVPGTGMLLAGRLMPLPMVIIFVPLTVALCYFVMRRLPAQWPRFGASAERRGVPAAALLVMVAIAAGFGVWQAFFRSEQVFVAGDPGVYLQYGYWIAGHATARIPESAAAFGGATGLDFATTGFSVSGNMITPAFQPGLPLVLAGGTWLGGVGGALLMPAVIGGCAVLSFAGLAGRLCGAWWAVAGELVLAVSLPEVYASRTPLSEPLVQVLLFGGLCLFIDAFALRRRDVGGSAGAGGTADASGAGEVLAGLGGLALGLTVLASVSSLAVLLPVFPVLAVLFVVRRPQAGPFGLGFFVGLGIGLAAALALERSYLSTVSAQLHLIGLCAAGFGLLTALMAPLAFPGARSRVRRACAFQVRFKWLKGETVVLPSLGLLLAGLAVALPVAVLAGLAARPYLQVVRGQADPAMVRQLAALQRLERLPVDGQRQYYESSLYWVFWYLGLPAVLLACAGAAVLGRRSVRAVLSERAVPSGTALRLWGLPFLIIGWSVVTVLWDPAVVPWQPLASHRLVPVVLPGLLLLALWMSSRLTSRASVVGASRAAIGLVGTCCLLALAIPPLVTTLNPGLAAKPSVGQYSSGVSKLVSRVRLRGVGASAAYGGSAAAASALCASIGPSASVLFVDFSTATTFAPVVRDLCGQPAALLVLGASASSASSASSALPASSAADVEQAARAIEQIGRRPVLLGPSGSSVSLPGVVAPRQVLSLATSGDAEVLTGPPAGTWPVTYSLWLAAPSGAVGASGAGA